MYILHVTTLATDNELQDIDLVAESLQWFTGTLWETYHGPRWRYQVLMFEKKLISEFINQLGKDNRKQLQEKLEQRMDENNVIHAQFDLEKTIGQIVSLTSQDRNGPVIKVKMKVAVYPEQEPVDIARQVLKLIFLLSQTDKAL